MLAERTRFARDMWTRAIDRQRVEEGLPFGARHAGAAYEAVAHHGPTAIDRLARERVAAHPERTRGNEDPVLPDLRRREDADARRVVLAALHRDRVPRGPEPGRL